MESLKAALHKKYRRADIDNTRFIGFKNKLKQSNTPKK
jgi:hypothetical protein